MFKSIKLFLIILTALISCTEKPKTIIPTWAPYDESSEIAENAEQESRRLRFKLMQSRVTDKNQMLQAIQEQIEYFSEEDYIELYPLIYEQGITTIQASVADGKLSYEKLVKWYLYRIAKYESNRETYLNAIISINPAVVANAKEKDKNRSKEDHPIYGIPVLLKDNINFEGIPTTAGAHVLKDNYTQNAFIAEQIIKHGGLILGKTNLSEWANYLCQGCPNGYSAVGGQTLHAYGRKKMDTGGSSSGSGVSIAANYATVAVGTETSGSILSPSSSSSLVGLKPTLGLLSRGGIVPISSTLDTPGPMTRTVMDNAILLSAMSGEDAMDGATKDNPKDIPYFKELYDVGLKGYRLGVNKAFLNDTLYNATIEILKNKGAILIEFDPPEVPLNGFGSLLNGDMKNDLKSYLLDYADKNVAVKSVSDIVQYNNEDTLTRIPYGQARFTGILEDTISEEGLILLRENLESDARKYFETPMQAHQLDAVLSINNYGAGYAAAAKYPCLTIPMGYTDKGRPMGLTFIARQFEEEKLLKIGYAYEQVSQFRRPPESYSSYKLP